MTQQMKDRFIFRNEQAEAIAISRKFDFSPFRDFGIETQSWATSNHRGFRCDYIIENDLRIQSLFLVAKNYAYPVINGVQPEPDPEWMQILGIMSKPGRAMESSYCPRLYKGINYKVDYSGLIAIGVGIEKERIGRDRYREVYELRFENGDLCNFIDITEAWKKQDEIEGEQRGYWWLKEENDYWFLLNYKSMGIP